MECSPWSSGNLEIYRVSQGVARESSIKLTSSAGPRPPTFHPLHRWPLSNRPFVLQLRLFCVPSEMKAPSFHCAGQTRAPCNRNCLSRDDVEGNWLDQDTWSRDSEIPIRKSFLKFPGYKGAPKNYREKIKIGLLTTLWKNTLTQNLLLFFQNKILPDCESLVMRYSGWDGPHLYQAQKAISEQDKMEKEKHRWCMLQEELRA